MPNAVPALEAAIAEVDRLRRIFKKTKAPQVRSSDERALAKATASAWFVNHRPVVETILSAADMHKVNDYYRSMLESSDRHGARSKYISTLAELRRELIALRTECFRPKLLQAATSDNPPDFSPLRPPRRTQRQWPQNRLENGCSTISSRCYPKSNG